MKVLLEDASTIVGRYDNFQPNNLEQELYETNHDDKC
jgi:hypothetical protein